MIAVLLSMCSWGRGMAAEVIAGRVVSVDREHRQIVMDPLETDKDRVVITFEHGRIPSGLQAGELIRIKGDFTVIDNGQLKSRKIWCSCPARLNWDRTGVRRRLFEGRGMGFGYGQGGGRHGRH